MTRISSKMTFFFKWVFPVLWFGIIGVTALVGGLAVSKAGQGQIAFLIVPCAMAGFGYLMMRTLLFDLMDEVWDDGDALVIRNRGKEERMPLSEIVNVSASILINPPRVTLTLREPGLFGREVTFSPPARILSFLPHPLIKDLIERVDAARRS